MIEKSLTITTIVPAEIITLCYQYFEQPSTIFLCTKIGYFSAQIGLIDTNIKSIRIKNISIKPQQNKTNQTDNIPIGYSTYSHASNINLPKSIMAQIASKVTQKPSSNIQYNLLFKCGGTKRAPNMYPYEYGAATSLCSAAILSNEFSNGCYDQYGFNWELPSLPQPRFGHSLAFCHKYGLFCIGGTRTGGRTRRSHIVYNLSFSSQEYVSQDESKWKWRKLRDMPNAHIKPKSVIFNDKLLVMGNENAADILNFNEDEVSQPKWTTEFYDITYPTTELFYHAGSNNIYAAFGQDIGYLDIVNNKWMKDIPPTNMEHLRDVIIWRDVDLLFIASTETAGNGVEYIDLREGKQWKILHGVYNPTLTQLFGIHSLQARFRKLCCDCGSKPIPIDNTQMEEQHVEETNQDNGHILIHGYGHGRHIARQINTHNQRLTQRKKKKNHKKKRKKPIFKLPYDDK